ncbi:Hypothetical protein UVM_LOCUS380, partial [uncultured virus]
VQDFRKLHVSEAAPNGVPTTTVTIRDGTVFRTMDERASQYGRGVEHVIQIAPATAQDLGLDRLRPPGEPRPFIVTPRRMGRNADVVPPYAARK